MTDYAAIIPILIVVLSAAAAMLAEAFRQPGERMPIAGLGLIGLVGAAIASVFLWDADARSFGVVRADNFALFVNLVLCIIGILTMLLSDEVVEREHIPPGEYYALTLFAISGMMLMAAATDLLVIFLALEVLSLSVYVLTGIRRASAAGAEAAFKYFLLGSFSSAFFLYGVAFAFFSRSRHASTRSQSRWRSRGRPRRAPWRFWPSACSPSDLPSRCRRCRSTCGRRMPTRARRQLSPRSCRLA
jgi:NADH-quinone oxidoreductase subunit N